MKDHPLSWVQQKVFASKLTIGQVEPKDTSPQLSAGHRYNRRIDYKLFLVDSTIAQASPSTEATTGSVSHIQIDTEPVPAVDVELRRRVFLIPGIEERESQISLPGARSLWLAEELALARPEVLQVGREFGHFHPDGSLHLWLPVDRAQEVDATKWGICQRSRISLGSVCRSRDIGAVSSKR